MKENYRASCNIEASQNDTVLEYSCGWPSGSEIGCWHLRQTQRKSKSPWTINLQGDTTAGSWYICGQPSALSKMKVFRLHPILTYQPNLKEH